MKQMLIADQGTRTKARVENCTFLSSRKIGKCYKGVQKRLAPGLRTQKIILSLNELLTRTQNIEETVGHPLRYNLLHQKDGNSNQHRESVYVKITTNQEQSSRGPLLGELHK